MPWLSKYAEDREPLGYHDDVIKWKNFPRYWPFVRGIHRSPVNSPHKGQWRRALMFSLICARIYGWVNNREAGDLSRHRAHYDVIVMWNLTLHALKSVGSIDISLQWRHHERDGVSNRRRLDCLLNRLFRRWSKKRAQIKENINWVLWGKFTGDRLQWVNG